jgi:hypothetical protein
MKPFPPIKRIRIRERAPGVTRLILLGVGKTDLDFARKLYKRISHQEDGFAGQKTADLPVRPADKLRAGAEVLGFVICGLGAAGIR